MMFSKKIPFLFFLGILSILLSNPVTGKEKEKGWDITKPRGPHKIVEFTVTEGTWMNLDVHPKGTEIVFDLLGDIYKLPIQGGEAVLLSGGPALEVHPRYSPDGTKILFTSDRGGADNIWVMMADGTEKRAITKEDYRLCNNAVWMPGGQYIVAKKHFSSHRSLGSGEMWLYHLSGTTGVRLTHRKNEQQDVGEPGVSPDGKYVYFSEDMSGGSSFQYNKDPNKQIYMIRRYSFERGRVENVVTGDGGAVRPQVSPGGKLLAFIRRDRGKSVLYLQEILTGRQWPIYDGMSRDQQETWATFGVYPNYNWTPDGKSIIFWARGKIWRIDVKSKKVAPIPFRAKVKQIIVEALKFKQKVFTPEFTVKMIRQPALSPDGKWLAFHGLGHIWFKELPGGKPLRMTAAREFEYYPSFSPDGKSLIYTTWEDLKKGTVKIYSLTEKKSRLLVEKAGSYHHPRFSADGKEVVYQRGGGNGILGFGSSLEPGLYRIPSSGGKALLVTREGSRPSFSPDGKRIFFFSHQGSKKAIKSVNLWGGGERTHFTSDHGTEIVLSPDQKWVAFVERFRCYLAPFPKTGRTIHLSPGMRELPSCQLGPKSAFFLHWSQDSQSIHWLLGEGYFSRSLKSCFSWLRKKDEKAEADPKVLSIGLKARSDEPLGTLALVGGRIITMKGREVIEGGTVIIQGNRIAALGKRENIKIPPEAKVIDVSLKTIIPGLIDVHAHMGTSRNGLSPQQQWSYYAALAYGVTTTHDPSANSEMVFSQSEMVRSGVMVGPRIYSTGTILYGASGDIKAIINNIEDARFHMERMKAMGAFSVKSYNQPRRNQRQQVIQAAREMKMLVVPEGGSFFLHNMTMILDGHTGIEHSVPVTPLYSDMIQLWRASKTGYTPTLLVAYGGLWGENYWYQKKEVWKDQRLLKYYPRTIIDARSRRRIMVPEEEFGHIRSARTCKALLDHGVRIQLGAHGQLHGLGSHWEMWAFVQGGFTPWEALRSATLQGAQYLSMESEIGSLEVGKLADLVVLLKNPLENIENSASVCYTVINGRIYIAETMEETGNYHRPREKFYWEWENCPLWAGEREKKLCGCQH